MAPFLFAAFSGPFAMLKMKIKKIISHVRNVVQLYCRCQLKVLAVCSFTYPSSGQCLRRVRRRSSFFSSSVVSFVDGGVRMSSFRRMSCSTILVVERGVRKWGAHSFQILLHFGAQGYSRCPCEGVSKIDRWVSECAAVCTGRPCSLLFFRIRRNAHVRDTFPFFSSCFRGCCLTVVRLHLSCGLQAVGSVPLEACCQCVGVLNCHVSLFLQSLLFRASSWGVPEESFFPF